MKAIYILFFMLIYNALNVAAQFNYLGLGHTLTTDLTIYNDTVYASTYDGLYKHNISTSDTNWVACGMQGNHIVQTLIKDHATFISVVEIGNTNKTCIYKSINGGSSFTLLLSDTSLLDNYQYLDHLANPANNFDTLYSLNHMKKTYNGGLTWVPINAHSLRFIKVHPVYHNEIFMGGENFIFSAELKRSVDYGSTFEDINMSEYFDGDNTVHDMEFVGDRWIGVGEGIISYSDDNGLSWVQSIQTWSYPSPWSMYILDVEKSDNGNIYASGETYSTNRLGLFFSENNGAVWDTLSFPSHNNTNPSTRCIATNSDNIFFGGNGVYRLNNTPNLIPSVKYINDSIDIYPNPSYNGQFTVQLNNCFSGSIINISVFDNLGRNVDMNYSGSGQISMEKKGVFVLCIRTNKRTIYKRIINL